MKTICAKEKKMDIQAKIKIALETGIVWIDGEVDRKMGDMVTEIFFSLIAKGSQRGDFVPVDVLINSGGGFTGIGLAIYDMIKAYPGTTRTVVFSRAGSAAALILQAGDVRVATPNARLLFHHLKVNEVKLDSIRNEEKFTELKNELIELHRRLNDAHDRKIVSDEEWETLLSLDEWIYPNQALKIGCLDEIITNPFSKK
jgi:ATP-dependent protease ClpP protease subunit